MFERTRHGNLSVMHYSFMSLDEFVEHLAHAQVARAFVDAQVSKQEYDEFTGTKSLGEAMHVCRFGLSSGYQEFFALDERVMRALDMNFDVVRTFNDYVGFAPDVKAYLEGSPLSMINKPEPPRKFVSVYMNTSYDSSIERDQIFHRGAAVLTAIKILEMLHYAVDLHLFEMSYCDMGDGNVEVHFSEFALKAPGERANVQKLFFPLCHPSWIRRLNFRLIETTPNISYHWVGTYGFPCEARMTRRVLELGEGNVLVGGIEELGIEGRDIVADARRVFACFNEVLPEEDRLKLKVPPANE